MATTFAYYVRQDQKADGTFPIKIRVTHNRRSKFLPTSFRVTRAQLSRDGKKIKDRRLLDLVDEAIDDLYQRFLTIKGAQYYTLEDLCATMTQRGIDDEGFRLDFFEYAERQISGMEAKTAEGYRTALNAVRRFIGRNGRLDINAITAKWVVDFKNFLENEPPVVGNGMVYRAKSRGSRAISYYLGCVRHIHNLARAEYNDQDSGVLVIPRTPFAANVVPAMPMTQHRDLSPSQIRAIMRTQPEPGSRAALAKDVFMLSFLLCGTNTIDLFNLKKKDRSGHLLTYNRAKTDSTRRDRAQITLKLLPEAEAIIERNKAAKGEHLLSFFQRYADSAGFNKAVNKGLKDLAKSAGLPSEITLQSYHARHSWATIARNDCRVDFDTVNAALNHAKTGSDRVTDIYIARDFSAIWEAQNAVWQKIIENCDAEIVKMTV